MSKNTLAVCLFACTLFAGCGDSGSDGKFKTKRDIVHTDKSPEQWLELIVHSNNVIRVQAVDAIVKYGKAYVGDLVDILKEQKSGGVRLSVCRALSGIGHDAEEAVPELCRQLKDKTWQQRDAAAEALGKIAGKLEQTIPALADALKDKEPGVRRMAARALGDIGSADSRAISALITAMEDESMDVRAEACSALGKIGPGARQAVTALEEAAKSEYIGVRMAAEGALNKIRRQ